MVCQHSLVRNSKNLYKKFINLLVDTEPESFSIGKKKFRFHSGLDIEKSKSGKNYAKNVGIC